MLARDAAAGVHAGAHHFCARGENALLRAGDALVEKQVRMQISVAGVEDVRDGESIRGGDRICLSQHFDELRARYDAVEDVVVRVEAAERADRSLAAGPQSIAIGLLHGETHLARVVPLADGLDGGRFLDCALLETVELDQ